MLSKEDERWIWHKKTWACDMNPHGTRADLGLSRIKP